MSVAEPAPEGPAPERVRRVDARRNLSAILEAAVATLSEDPRASMQQIARAAGLHRATVHRHFASRDDLVDAVRLRSFEDSAEAVAQAEAATAPSPAARLRRATEALLVVGDRYRLYRYTTWRDPGFADRSAEIAGPVTRMVRAAQASGELRTDVDADDLAVALYGLVTSALPNIAAGRQGVEASAALALRLISAPEG